MALDGVTLAYLVKELAPQLIGARIDKIHQPEKEEIHFQVRQQGDLGASCLVPMQPPPASTSLKKTRKTRPPHPCFV